MVHALGSIQSGSTAVTVAPVTGSIHTVTVNIGDGTGTIPRDVIDNDTIHDSAFSKPLGGPGRYRYQLMQGTITLYTKPMLAGACGTVCANTPTTILTPANYKWRVQALIGGVWSGYSPYKLFTLSTR